MSVENEPEDKPEDTLENQRLLVRLDAIRYAALSVNQFEFKRADGGPLPAFDAGSHIDLFLGNGLVRQYSLASSSHDQSRYAIGVKRELKGRGGSAWMFDHFRVGDLIEISSPRNNFALNAGPEPSVLIAGGIGITPMVSMIDQLARAGREWRLFYSVRQRAEAAFLDELRPHSDRIRVHVDEEHDSGLMNLTAIINSAASNAHLYCCGPAPMLDAFEQSALGRPATHVHLERLSATSKPVTTGGFVVELARAKRRVLVNPGQSIAEALVQAGVKISVSCEQGICGTCETRVLAGVPEHRDSLLSAQEKAANNVIMICCSGSLSQTLVLDL